MSDGIRSQRTEQDRLAAARLWRKILAAGPVIDGADEGRELGHAMIDEFTRFRLELAESSSLTAHSVRRVGGVPDALIIYFNRRPNSEEMGRVLETLKDHAHG